MYTNIVIIFFCYKNSTIYVQFVEIKCVEHDLVLQTVNTEFETGASSLSKIVTNTCFHHVYSVNTSMWKRSHVYTVNSVSPVKCMLYNGSCAL